MFGNRQPSRQPGIPGSGDRYRRRRRGGVALTGPVPRPRVEQLMSIFGVVDAQSHRMVID